MKKRLYKTCAAIGRPLQSLAERNSLLQKPFLCYGRAFLRISHAASKGQEFAADQLTACLSSRPLIEGLKLIYGAALAFNAYWSNQVAPVLSRGFHPPMAERFRRYLASPHLVNAVAASLDRALIEGEMDPFDTPRHFVSALLRWRAGRKVPCRGMIHLQSPCLRIPTTSMFSSSTRLQMSQPLRP
jgi:hypothetical protein